MDSARATLALTHDDRVAVITLAAPKANVLDGEMIAAIAGHLDGLATRDDLVALVIAAEGPHFSFGASVEEHLPARIGQTLDALHQLLRKLLTTHAPTIAAVRGQCLGGGFELVLACDLVIADAEARFACPEIKLGVFPPAASVLLPVRIGGSRACADRRGTGRRGGARRRTRGETRPGRTPGPGPGGVARRVVPAAITQRPSLGREGHAARRAPRGGDTARRSRAPVSRSPDEASGPGRRYHRVPGEAAAALGREGDAVTDLAAIVQRAETLAEDLDLATVRAWKAAAPGRRAIGFMPIAVPRELIHAAGMLPVGILGGGDRLEIIRGDAYFQSYICHIPRSTIELALSGRLDALDGMLFPSICDVIRNLSGMWQLLFPGRYVRYVDLPQNFDPALGGQFWRRELDILRHDFRTLSGHHLDDDALRASVAIYNENRAAIRRLYGRRSAEPWKYPTSEVYQVLRAGMVLPPEEHTRLVREYTDAAAADPDRHDQDRSRVILVGMFCEQPPLGLLVTLERAGCWIVDDDLLLGLRWLVDDVPLDGDPLENLTQAFLDRHARTASMYEPDGHRGSALVESVRRHRADGVIFCAASFCDPALLDQPMLVAALDAAGVPHTQFKFSEDTGQFAVIREQAGTFSDSIRLWSET
jgi:benzoyl-CoA reductase subunit C